MARRCQEPPRTARLRRNDFEWTSINIPQRPRVRIIDRKSRVSERMRRSPAASVSERRPAACPACGSRASRRCRRRARTCSHRGRWRAGGATHSTARIRKCVLSADCGDTLLATRDNTAHGRIHACYTLTGDSALSVGPTRPRGYCLNRTSTCACAICM